MILKNLFLSEFKGKNFFGDKKIFFAVNKIGGGNLENGDELDGILDNLEGDGRQGGTENEEKIKPESIFSSIDFGIDKKNIGESDEDFEKRRQKFDDVNSYLESEIFQFKSGIKPIMKLVLDKIISGENELTSEESDEINEIINGVGEESALAKKLVEALDKNKNKDYDERLNDLKSIFFEDVERVKRNFEKIKEKLNEKKKQIDEKIGKLVGIKKDILKEESNKLFQKELKKVDDALEKFSKQMDGDNFLDWINEKIGKKNFDAVVKSEQNKKDGDGNLTDVSEAKINAFNRISDGAIDFKFKKIKQNFKINEGSIFALESEIDEDLQILEDYEKGEGCKKLEDCQEILDELPFLGKDFLEKLFHGGNLNFEVFEAIFKQKFDFDGEDVKKIDKLKKEILSLGENANEKLKKDPIILGKLYKTFESLRDKIYEDILREYSVLKNYDTSTKEGRKQLIEKFNQLLEVENIKVEDFESDDELKDENDLEKLGKVSIDVFNSAKSELEKILKGEEFIKKEEDILDQNGNKIGVKKIDLNEFYGDELNFLNSLKNNCDSQFEIVAQLENDLKSEEDEINREFLRKRILEEKNKLKDLIKKIKVEKSVLEQKNNAIYEAKEKNDEYLQQRGPQTITLASIVLMIKKIYEEYKGGIKAGNDLNANKAAGAMAQSFGEALGFDDAIMAGRAMSRNADAKYQEWFESNVKKYQSYDISQLNENLKMMAETSKFNGTDLYGVLENLAEKGGFNPDNYYFLKALASKDDSFLDSGSNIDERIKNFLNLSKLEKNKRLSKVIGKTEMFRNREKFDEWVSKADNGYESSKSKALNRASEFGNDYHIKMYNNYLNKAKEQKVLDENGCLIPGKHVDYDPLEISPGEFHEFINKAISKKILDPKEAFLYIFNGVAIGLIPPRYAQSAIEKDLAGIFGWLDEFKKEKIDLKGFIEIRNKIFLEDGKQLVYNDENLTSSERKKVNDKIMNKLGVFIKEKSDNFFDETTSEIGPDETKWWSELRMGKLKYDDFERVILGTKGTPDKGTDESENLTAFINGTSFELNYFGKKIDKNGKFVDKELNEISLDELLRIRETFKTFGAYYASKIIKTYNDPSIASKDIDDSQMNKPPKKFNGHPQKGLTDQALTYVNLLKSFGPKGEEIIRKIESGNGVNEYFKRGSGPYKKDIDKLFEENPKMIIKNIKEYQKSNDFISVV